MMHRLGLNPIAAQSPNSNDGTPTDGDGCHWCVNSVLPQTPEGVPPLGKKTKTKARRILSVGGWTVLQMQVHCVLGIITWRERTCNGNFDYFLLDRHVCNFAQRDGTAYVATAGWSSAVEGRTMRLE